MVPNMRNVFKQILPFIIFAKSCFYEVFAYVCVKYIFGLHMTTVENFSGNRDQTKILFQNRFSLLSVFISYLTMFAILII